MLFQIELFSHDTNTNEICKQLMCETTTFDFSLRQLAKSWRHGSRSMPCCKPCSDKAAYLLSSSHPRWALPTCVHCPTLRIDQLLHLPMWESAAQFPLMYTLRASRSRLATPEPKLLTTPRRCARAVSASSTTTHTCQLACALVPFSTPI